MLTKSLEDFVENILYSSFMSTKEMLEQKV